MSEQPTVFVEIAAERGGILVTDTNAVMDRIGSIEAIDRVPTGVGDAGPAEEEPS